MKKTLFLAVICSGLILAGCGSEPEKQEIKNLSYDGEYISWSSISGASGYVINIDQGMDIRVNQSSSTIRYRYDSAGEDFSFSVEALVGERGDSNNPTYEIQFENTGDVLNFRMEDGLLTWDYLDDAEGYQVFVNGQLQSKIVTANTFEVNPGDFNAKVRSYKQDKTMYNNNNRFYSLWTSSVSGKLLEPVTNLSFDSDQFKWKSVTNATSYTIKIGENEFQTTSPNYVTGALTNDLSVQVRANGDPTRNLYNSKWSVPKEYKYIPALTTIRVENGALVWDKPENATKYKIKVNGVVQEQLLTTEKYDQIQPGVSTTIQVLPVADTELFYSSWSNPMTINILRSPSITYENNVIKWNAIPGAEGYSINIVKDKDREENFTVGSGTLTYNYDFELTGAYEVRVKATIIATGNGVYESKYSNTLNFSHLATPSMPTVINQPLEENQVMISSVIVANASKYYLYSNDVMIKESSTPVFNVDIRTINDSSDEVVVKLGIKAVGSVNDNDIYLDSDIREFTVTKLAAPKNLEINGNQLTWSNVTNADRYIVTIDGVRTEVTSNYYTITDIAAGQHSIYVQAEGNGENVISSSHSNGLTVTKLAKPVISTTKVGEKFYIQWQAIEGATAYNVTLGNQYDTAPSNSFIISDKLNYFTAGQGTQVSVYAKGNGSTIMDSDPSNTQTILRYEAPTNLSLTSDNLIWNAPSVGSVVANNFSLVVDNGDPINLTGTTYSLANFTAGKHTVKIKANGRVDNLTIDSDYSSEFSFTKLGGITGLTKNGTTLSWDAVDGASAYEVKLSQDSLPVSVNTNSFDVSYSRAGTYAISVAAKGDNMTVADGEKLSFNQVVRNITAPVKDSTFTIERVGDEVMIQMNGNELATAYVLYVGGALAQVNQTGIFYYTVTPESLSYSFQVAYLGGKFGSDGNYYIDSNKSAEVIINY